MGKGGEDGNSWNRVSCWPRDDHVQLRTRRVVRWAGTDLEREIVKRGACLKGRKEKGRFNGEKERKALIILKDVLA